MKVSLQLYSLRDAAKDDFLGVIRAAGKMGYDGVEFAGYFDHTADKIKAVLGETGLECSGAHVPVSAFEPDKFAETVAFHQAIGCPYPIIPWIPEEKRNTPEAALQTAQEMTALAEKLEPHGLRTGFHVHDGDVKPLSNGQSFWDIVAANTPDSFILQYDTCNGANGGADPLQPILDHPGRGVSLHLKGFPAGTPVGEGGLDWPKIIDACRNVAGSEWIVLEHETYINMTPEEACQRCLDNVRRLL